MHDWHRCQRWWRRKMECPFGKMEEHDDFGEDPPDEETEFPPTPLPIPAIPPVHSTDEEAVEREIPEEVQDPALEEVTEEVVRETVPEDIPAETPDAEPAPAQPELPIPVLPGPGGARQGAPGPGPGRAQPGRSPGRIPQPVGAISSPSTLRAPAGRANTQLANTPPAAAIATNRAFRGLVATNTRPSRSAARSALVRPPPGAAQASARPNRNLRGVERVGPGRQPGRGLIGELNRVRAGVAEEATARTFQSRAIMVGAMGAAAAVSTARASRAGRFRRARAGRSAGAGFFFNQSAQMRRLLR